MFTTETWGKRIIWTGMDLGIFITFSRDFDHIRQGDTTIGFAKNAIVYYLKREAFKRISGR